MKIDNPERLVRLGFCRKQQKFYKFDNWGNKKTSRTYRLLNANMYLKIKMEA